MAIVTGDRYLESLVKFVENNTEPLIEGTLVLKLNPVGLRYVQSRLEALAELESLLAGAPVDYLRAYVSDLGDHRALEQLRRILRLLPSLKVVSMLPPPGRDPTPLYLLPFGRLKILEIRGCNLSASAARGLLELRHTLEKLICHNSTDALRHIFASRIAEIKDSPQWNRLSFISCACNGLMLMDESLQLLPAAETIDLSRNKFAKVDNLRKCTKLKHLDLGFNNLRSIASFSEVSCQIVKLVLRNNALTTLRGIENLKSLEGLDLSFNVISNFSEIEILAGLPSLQSLWLEGNPLCSARWYRSQVFSLFLHPEKLKLDEKRMSPREFWKRQIIVASQQRRPASFGFYSPAKGDAGLEGTINTNRRKISRLVSIESEEQSTYIYSDQDSVSCDNEIQTKEDNDITDEEAEIADFMRRIELMKKERSVLWLQEFKEWMNQASDNFVDDSKCGRGSRILSNNREIHMKSEAIDENLGASSRYISDSVQLSGDESSTVVLESETSFVDTSTVVSAQQYFNRIGEVASKFFMGHASGDRSVVKSTGLNHEHTTFLNDGHLSADTRNSPLKSLGISRGKDVSAKNINSYSVAIDDIIVSRSSSACPGSPPHYQADILHRRQNLEEEFLQLSAESFSVASSDSNTSCSDDDSGEIGASKTQVDQSMINKISGSGLNGYFSASQSGDADQGERSKLKENGTHTSDSSVEGNSNNISVRELDRSTYTSSNFTDGVHDGEIVSSLKQEADWLEKKKFKRKPKKRMISLQEEDGHGDSDSSKKSNDNVEKCRNDKELEKEICCATGDLQKPCAEKNTCESTTNDYRGHHSGVTTSNSGKDDVIESYFNLNIADSGSCETCTQYTCCNCLFQEKSGHFEREVAILRSSKDKLYVLIIVEACDGSATTLEMVGCHGVGDVRDAYVGLGVQVVRVCFDGNAAYLFITRCIERSRELLWVLEFFDLCGIKDYCSLTSLEQIQVHLLEQHVCGCSNINIFQYSMVLFWQNNLKDLWLSRSLFIVGGQLLVCIEDLEQFGPTELASSNYFSLDSSCAIVNISEMVIDTLDGLCVTLALNCTSELRPVQKECTVKDAAVIKKGPVSGPVMWKLKWFSEGSLFKFVALLKAIHAQATSSSSLLVKYIS
ncbi:Binding, isoform 1 [Olea europaea subsp. europaea]|uniref:Binding, isoform 1 n=1 Tax=Olea europaea subsp. europaea TaxID=158383 RepID=A0A8S0RAG2_OLEEU|nr:Binding, isoform 1 [Olea europaea subsp. europaea]